MQVGVELIGRSDELAELDRLLDGSGPGALAIRGEAGVGKTALTGEFAGHAAVAGWRVLRAIGVEAEKPFSLGGLNQMVYPLRSLLAGLDAHDREVLAPVFGADPVQAPSPMPLALAVLALLDVAAAVEPVLVVVDDVQWLDELSATVLSAVGRRVANPRVRVVASYRPNSGADVATAGWAQLALAPLATDAAAAVVDRMNLPLSAVARQTILDVAAGNPLALEELPRCADQIDGWTTALPLTDRLVTVFGGRLQMLTPEVRAELLRAALDGTKSLGAPIGPVGAHAARYAMTDVQTAVEQDLLTVDPLGDIVFRHPLVRAAVIHQASPQDRRAAHAALAELYDDVLVRRATHLSAASTTPHQGVADLLDEAARLSIRRGGAAVAVDWLRRAAELSTDARRRVALRSDAAFVAAQAGRFDDAQTFVDSSADEAESASAVAMAAYLAFYRDGEVRSGHRRLVGVLSDPSALDDATAMRLVKLLLAISMYSGDPELWHRTEAAVDAMAHRLDDVALVYRDAWGDTARRGHTVRARLTEHVDSLAALEPWEVMRLAVAAYYVDALADFRTTLQRLYDRERDRGAVTNAMTMLHLLLLDQIGGGRWTQAEESAREGLALTSTHRIELFGYQFTAYDGLRAAYAGDAETARRAVAEVRAWAGPRQLGLLLGFSARTEVLVALADGDYDAAYRAAQQICTPGDFPPYAHHALESVFDVVDAAVHSGHVDEARAHITEAQRLGLSEISPRLRALVAGAAAMTDPAQGDGFVAALSDPTVVQFPFDHARIQLAQGMWLRRQRHHIAARDVLGAAAEAFEDLGAAPWAERARTELRAAGGGVQRASGDAVVLSAQERTIAELAAAGHSNKQIGAQLYLSPRTVGAHLYRIFPKLGVTSRAGLGQALRGLEGE